MQHRSARSWIAVAQVFAAMIVASCGGEETITGPRIATLSIVSGSGQTAPTGSTLSAPLVVLVADQNGAPVVGETVTWTVVSGGGIITPPQSTTGNDGHATATLRLGTTAGTNRVEASLGNIQPVEFVATATAAGLPNALLIISGNNQIGSPGAPLPDSLRVLLVDQFGNGVSGVAITWSPATGSGTVSPTTSTTDANGFAATRWTLGNTRGPVTVIASGAGFVQTFTGGGSVIFAVLTAGARHSCGLEQGGVAYCWGYNGDGQLGIGVAPQGSGPIFALPQPTGATGNLTFSQLLDGRFHTCALTLAGVGYCWGNNLDGRVGGGTLGGSVLSPTILSGTTTWTQIAPGNLHTCGLDVAGRPFCWGSNSDGQLGDGTTTNHTAATALPGGFVFSAIAGGGLHSCAVTGAGAAWCWGSNAAGQLGNGTTTTSTSPITVFGGLTLSAITTGYGHTCAIDMTGGAYCWGANADGQLGDGSGLSRTVPTLVSGVVAFSAISAGLNHTCGVSTVGALYCWGRNDKGQLGDGTTSSHLVPTLVTGGLTFRSVSAGDAHTCGVTTANVAYCWGDNQFGQLGDGTLTDRPAPTKVAFQQ